MPPRRSCCDRPAVGGRRCSPSKPPRQSPRAPWRTTAPGVQMLFRAVSKGNMSPCLLPLTPITNKGQEAESRSSRGSEILHSSASPAESTPLTPMLAPGALEHAAEWLHINKSTSQVNCTDRRAEEGVLHCCYVFKHLSTVPDTSDKSTRALSSKGRNVH